MIKHILLVDGDLDDVSLFEEALRDVDPVIAFHSAKNGTGALEFLLGRKAVIPDLIVLDINMPEMDGWQCLTELKRTPSLRQIPVVMYSTSNEKMGALKAADLGAVGIYQKPERFENLRRLLKGIISDFVR